MSKHTFDQVKEMGDSAHTVFHKGRMWNIRSTDDHYHTFTLRDEDDETSTVRFEDLTEADFYCLKEITHEK